MHVYSLCARCVYFETGSCLVRASATRRYASCCLGMNLKNLKFTPPEVYGQCVVCRVHRGDRGAHLRLSSYGSQIYVCVRESWARSMRTCALALRVQVRHKYMLSTCEKPIVICVRLLMKQGRDCVMAAALLSVVMAPFRELGLDPST